MRRMPWTWVIDFMQVISGDSVIFALNGRKKWNVERYMYS